MKALKPADMSSLAEASAVRRLGSWSGWSSHKVHTNPCPQGLVLHREERPLTSGE